ncbi:MAG: hypothetical protein ACRDWA_17565 [Acidimicrobiia bacterium]
MAERDLTDAIAIALPLRGLDPTADDPVDHSVEVVHEDGDRPMAGVLRLLLDRDRAVLGELPRLLGVVGYEGRLTGEIALPGLRSMEVPNVELGKRARVPSGHRKELIFAG